MKGKKKLTTIYILDAISFELMVTVFLFLIRFLFINNLYYDIIITFILGGIWTLKINQINKDIRYITRIRAEDLEGWIENDVLNGAGRTTRLKLTMTIEFFNFVFLTYLFYLILN